MISRGLDSYSYVTIDVVHCLMYVHVVHIIMNTQWVFLCVMNIICDPA